MKFAHIADTHIRNLKYQKEYRAVFEKLYETLREEKVDYIIHCGDIAHTKTQISPEFVELCSDFFRNLESIAPTYIILGNHDGNLKNNNRQDALTPIAEALNLPNLHLLKKAGEVDLDGGFSLNVLSVFDEDNWVSPSDDEKINIALYHGSIAGVMTDAGWVMEHGDHTPEIFKEHDFAFLGDIHKTNQIIDTEGRVRYCGSTVQQNHGESNDKGFLIWDIQSKDKFTCKHHKLLNPKPFVTIELTKSGKIPNGVLVPVGARLRIVSNNNLPLVKMRRALEAAKHRYKPEAITFLNRAAGQRGDVSKLAQDIKQENLRDITVQERLISEYLKDYEVTDDVLQKVYELNLKYNKVAEEHEEVARNVNWNLQSACWDNLFNYGSGNKIDFSKLNGIVGVFGKNYSGKSSVIDSMLYTIWNSTSKNERKNLNIINQNKDEGSGLVKVRVGEKTYTIDRRSEKYVKKLHGSESVEAKTNIDFSCYNEVTQESVSLNGLTRNETDKNIRKVFGSLDDFLFSSMSSQLDALSFLKEGSTKRKEIFAKFLDLEIFEKKFRLAKKDASDLRGAIKRLEGRDFNEEISEATTVFEDSEEQLAVQQAVCESLKGDMADARQEILEIKQKIDSIPVELVDIAKVLGDIDDNTRELNHLRSNLLRDKKELGDKASMLDKIISFLADFNIEDVRGRKEESIEVYQKIKILEKELEIIDKKIATLEDPGFLKGCKCLNEAEQALKEKPDKDGQLSDLNNHVRELNPEEAEETISKFNELNKRKSNLSERILKLNLYIQQDENKIENLERQLDVLHDKRKGYQTNKEAIDNLEGFLAEKRNKEATLVALQSSLDECQETIMNLYKVHGSCEEKLNTLVSLQKELDELRQEYSAYDLFMRCMHNNGIAYDVIKKRLPALNEEIAKVLANIVDFEIFFEDDGKRLNIFIKHPSHEPRPLEMGSGAEKTIAAMAIRLALLSVSSLPKGDIFILDEPGTALDADNMEGFVRILDVVKSYFKTVLLITHLDSLKDCVDTQITIDKINGYAFINQ